LVENRGLNLPRLYLAPTLVVTLLEYRRDFWRQRTRVLDYRMALSSWSCV